MSLKKRENELKAYLARMLKAKGEVGLCGEKRITMGQSRAMYILDVAYEGEEGPVERKVVARIEQWGHLGSDSRNEVATMRALHKVDFPVAKILSYETTDDVLGQPFFTMDFVPGSSVFSEEVVDEYLQLLHKLHRVDYKTPDFEHLERPESLAAPARRAVDHLYSVYCAHVVGEPSPLVAECVQWLRNNAVPAEEITLVHGDPGPGNYMHHNGRIAILNDWEFTALGDPYDDWAYVIWMRGAPYLPEEDWIARIERTIGKPLDRSRLHFWKAVNILKGVCLDQTSHKLYVDGVNPAPNLLAIATAVHLDVVKKLCATVLEG